MIDLHLHFDGSLLPRTVLELAREQGIRLPAEEPDELKLFLTAPEDCKSLNEYLEKFDLPLLVLQTKEAIRKGMYTLVSSLKEQGMLYAEIRFAPQLHTRKGMSQEQVVKAAVLGMQEAMAGSFFKAKLILCCMRGADNREENLQTVRTAAAFLGRGVAAADSCRGGGRSRERGGGDSYGSQPDRPWCACRRGRTPAGRTAGTPDSSGNVSQQQCADKSGSLSFRASDS